MLLLTAAFVSPKYFLSIEVDFNGSYPELRKPFADPSVITDHLQGLAIDRCQHSHWRTGAAPPHQHLLGVLPGSLMQSCFLNTRASTLWLVTSASTCVRSCSWRRNHCGKASCTLGGTCSIPKEPCLSRSSWEPAAARPAQPRRPAPGQLFASQPYAQRPAPYRRVA